ncbi:aminotransferase-like domain-containing protein [Chitinimonas taiwanensis]|jgi:DNA-binding transcriptional MocR family regulator|uniref:Putative 8-amino-7-oxononanoate synthase n=1 Tax=Chitinimonas taiwanensis DSM 18899 TaxID=1121279 RepID=A0A1K2HQ90_9NEIS|nr:PLP-dependent aminotransferase family protein [Chitinimonas taiwanensis]SFZ78915.1 transcriptional regulator, GntR family [Chitinimonas taiwanensis DSM 18899]
MTPLVVDHAAARPLVEQIVEQFIARIGDKSLRAGSRLPSIRRFAAEYHVSKFTVVEAYDRLVALGYVQSRRGAGFFVASRMEASSHLSPRREPPLRRCVDSLWLLRHDALTSDANLLRPGCGWLPADWMPQAELEKALRDLTRRPNARLTSYGEPFGYRPLRQQLCVRLAELEIEAQPEQIVLTAGAMQALDLIARYLVDEGDVVLVDEPGFFNLFANQKLNGARLLGVPRTPNGPDVAVLEQLLAEHQPKLFITNSVLHNPTGTSLNRANAFRILQLAEKYDLTIVEDDIFSDFQTGPGERLAALDQLNRVIYIGSFSKTLSANLRVGYIVADPRRAQDLCDLKLLTSLSTSEVAERVMHAMLTEGAYRKHMERVKTRLKQVSDAVLPRLENMGYTLWAQPSGGMFCYARLPGVMDTAPLAQAAVEEGLMLAPGSLFCPRGETTAWLRFNLAHMDNPRVWDWLARAAAVEPAKAL